MGLGQSITDHFRRWAGDDGLADELLAAWRDALAITEDLSPALQARLTTVEQALGEGRSAARGTLREVVACLRAITAERAAQMRVRDGGSRSWQRAAAAHELKLAQLRDEIEGVRRLIAEECRRRNLRQLTTGDDASLRNELWSLLQAISSASSKRLKAAATDPVLTELLSLIDGADSAAIERFPQWLREPAGRLIALVGERNRYRRLLDDRGLLPR